nr:hypothetical protein [Tanacetum cinerariifolium]
MIVILTRAPRPLARKLYKKPAVMDEEENLLKDYRCGGYSFEGARVLLKSSKPSLHTNINCSALVSRQVSIVLLLGVGTNIDTKVQLGAWSWDMATCDEFRVGAEIAEPYPITWCAVEYFEASGTILQLLLQRLSPNTYHNGRTWFSSPYPSVTSKRVTKAPRNPMSFLSFSTSTLLKLCPLFSSKRRIVAGRVAVLHVIKSGTIAISTNSSFFSLLKFAAHSGDIQALKAIVDRLDTENIDINDQDCNGFSAVMVIAIQCHVHAFKLLMYAGADVKLINKNSENAISLSKLNGNSNIFKKVMLQFNLEKGNKNGQGFYPLDYAAGHGDIHAVKLSHTRGYDVNALDVEGYTPFMLAAKEGGVVQEGEHVVCLEAEVGPCSKFQKCRKAKRDNDTSGVIRVVTDKKKEAHFVCEGGCEMVELWVRGIRLLTMKALIGRLKSRVYYECMEPFKSLMCLWVRNKSIAAIWLEKVVTPLIEPAIMGFAAAPVVLKPKRLKVDKTRYE